MSLFTLIITAFGLSMDAVAVSLTSGIILSDVKLKHALKIGLFFGLFQGLMPLIGWLLGSNFHHYITHIDHWIAFIVLAFIGIKMIYDSFKEDGQEENINPLDNKTLILLAIATSIDALAVGISFAFLRVSIVSSVITIGLITFILSTLGVLIGKKSEKLIKKKATVLGGLILTIIGTRILIEHIMM